MRRDNRFIGRESELDLLRGDVVAARSGAEGIAFIHGEAGIGKTSLARAFASEMEASGARVLWGRGYEGGWSPPYTPWLEAIPDIAASAEPVDAFDPDEARFRYHDAIARHLRELSDRQLLVLVLDDLQWADVGSLELLRHLSHFSLDAPMYIVVGYRDSDIDAGHPLPRLQSQLQRTDRVRSLKLEGLQSTEITRLLETAGVSGVHADEADRLRAATNGNPLFITELIEHRLTVPDSPGLSGSTATISGAIPNGVQHAVQYRLERLSTSARSVLNNVAVFSLGFDFAVLPHLTGLSESELLDAIDELLGARLIEAKHAAGAERYDFVHSMVRAALIAPLNPSRVVRLERNAAVAMEHAYGDGADARAAELAMQYGRSASLAGAEAGLRYALIAADRARRGFDREQMAFFYGIARDLVSHSVPEIRASVLSKLAVAQADAVQIEQARASGADAIQALEQGGAGRSEVATFYADLVTSLKQHASAESKIWRPLLDAGLAIAGSEHDRIWARLVLLADPVQPISRGEINAGRWLGYDSEAIAIARSSSDERTAARAVESFDYRNRSETAEYLSHARTWKDPTAVMYGLTVSANDLQYRHGAFREAELIWDELISLAARQGAINWQAQAFNQLTFLHIARGRFADARASQQRANELLDQLGAGRRSDMLALEMETSFAYELGGDWQSLATRWRMVISDPNLGPNDPATLMGTYNASIAALCYAKAGEPASARSLLDALTPILESLTPFDSNQNGAVATAASAVWELGLTELAPRFFALTSGLWENEIGDFPQTSVPLTLARMAAISGRYQEAEEYFARARSELDLAGQRPLRARVDLDEAQALQSRNNPNNVEKSSELLVRAIESYEQLGMEGASHLARQYLANLTNDLAESEYAPAGLSGREVEVIRLVALGYSDRQIGESLYISLRTVHSHVRNILNKTGAMNRTSLSVWAMEQGLIERQG